MSHNGTMSERTPLSVLLFHAAMTRNQSLSSFAEDLDIGAISLRQFILGKTQRPRQKTLETIGTALGMSVDEVRDRMDIAPEAAPTFGDWLQAHMTPKFSRARLTRETKISDGALRNYLSGQTLPDSDQAQRLAEVLDASPFEVARVIVANQVVQAGGTVVPPQESEAAPSAREDGASGAPTFDALPPPSPLPPGGSHDEHQLIGLWRQLHPQARRATLNFIAMLLAER